MIREQEWKFGMANDTLELGLMQKAYEAAVEEWISAIKREETLASVNHSIAEVDKWEQAHFREDQIRSKVKAAKKRYADRCAKSCMAFKRELSELSSDNHPRLPMHRFFPIISSVVDRQNELEQRSAFTVRQRRKFTAMIFNNPAANSQPQSHSLCFCCNERIKYCV
jgi:hypothetical protein